MERTRYALSDTCEGSSCFTATSKATAANSSAQTPLFKRAVTKSPPKTNHHCVFYVIPFRLLRRKKTTKVARLSQLPSVALAYGNRVNVGMYLLLGIKIPPWNLPAVLKTVSISLASLQRNQNYQVW